MDSLNRSWVDLFSNRSYVKNLDNTTLTDILLDQRFPKEIFFSLIHEATHHWSFNSLVGNVIYFLKTRAFLSSLEIDKIPQYVDNGAGPISTNDAYQDLRNRIYADATKFRTFEKVLKPITEGMALFSEYDLVISKCEVTPSFMTYAMIVFSGYSFTEYGKTSIAQIETAFYNFLLERRIFSREGIRKKAVLFVSPLDLHESPYLGGYLFIKNLHSILISQHEKFKDKGLFLEFIKAYYFYDVGLALLLIDSDLLMEDIVPAMMERINVRTALLTQESYKLIEQFEEKYLSADPMAVAHHLYSPKETGQFLSKWETDFGVLTKDRLAVVIWFMRSFFRTTALPCFIKVRDEQILIYLRFPLKYETEPSFRPFLENNLCRKTDKYFYRFAGSFPNLEGYEAGEGEAIFEKYTSLDNPAKKFEVFLLSERQIFYPIMAGGLSNDELNEVKKYFGKIQKGMDAIDMDEAIDAVLGKDDPAFSTIDEFQEANYGLFFDWLESLAIRCSNDKLNELRKLMKEEGFLKILDDDIDLVYLLAYISLACSNGCYDYKIFKVLPFELYSQEELNKLVKILQSFELSLVEIKTDHICTGGF